MVMRRGKRIVAPRRTYIDVNRVMTQPHCLEMKREMSASKRICPHCNEEKTTVFMGSKRVFVSHMTYMGGKDESFSIIPRCKGSLTAV